MRGPRRGTFGAEALKPLYLSSRVIVEPGESLLITVKQYFFFSPGTGELDSVGPRVQPPPTKPLRE